MSKFGKSIPIRLPMLHKTNDHGTGSAVKHHPLIPQISRARKQERAKNRLSQNFLQGRQVLALGGAQLFLLQTAESDH